MYMTPKFSSFIDFIAVAIGAFEGRKRKKVFSELKTFSAKQVYFSDFIEQAKLELNFSDSEMAFISESIFKVENILSNLRSTPLYTDIPQGTASHLFFYQFTVPFIKQLCSLTSELADSLFFHTLDKFLFSKKECNSLRDVISLFKKEISSELSDIDANSATEFKLALSKLDERSFPSRSSIKNHIDKLHHNILTLERKGQSRANSFCLRIHTIFFAAKVAFIFTKYREAEYGKVNIFDSEIENLFLLFNKEYTLNINVPSEDDSYTTNAKFITCKNHFLEKIKQENPVLYLKENGTSALWKYKNGIFLSYAIREQLLWDINKRLYSEGGINKFIKNFIPELSKRQTGTDGVDIAVILIGMKVLLSKNITNNSLEPLINFCIDNLEKHNLISFVANTPFGSYLPKNLTASEINIALAIRTFNESVFRGVVNVKFCNPLSPLNELLNTYFDNGALTKRVIERKPIKTEKTTTYDALRNINYYILAFGLEEKTQITKAGYVNVLSSKSGAGINNYLSLVDEEKKRILNLISPEEFSLDLEKYHL